MKEPRLPPGSSDPLTYTCTCSSPDGLILLFYRYYKSPPTLTPSFTPAALAAFHSDLATRYQLAGKFRIANEGFNITVGGSREGVGKYVRMCIAHESFAGLGLSLSEEQEGGGGEGGDVKEKEEEEWQFGPLAKKFFKPSTGCSCAFSGLASVRIVEEITPMGVSGYEPKWGTVERLSPEKFHELCSQRDDDDDGGRCLIDVRNHYESRIGYFVDRGAPEGERVAIRPGIRRFAQWPKYASKFPAPPLSQSSSPENSNSNSNSKGNNEKGAEEEEETKKQKKKKKIITYCTGGIRCEKGAHYLAEQLGPSAQICTLEGGIAAYLLWLQDEIRHGRKTASDSLFRGRNYVFDARGSLGIEGPAAHHHPVAKCHLCDTPADALGKCETPGCHLILVVCGSCKEGGNRLVCCADCGQRGEGAEKRICLCEMRRETELWGEEEVRRWEEKARMRKKKGGKAGDGGGEINIRVKRIE